MMQASGQVLQMSQYMALYTLLGNQYGGDGIQTFALPNLSGRFPVGAGAPSAACTNTCSCMCVAYSRLSVLGPSKAASLEALSKGLAKEGQLLRFCPPCVHAARATGMNRFLLQAESARPSLQVRAPRAISSRWECPGDPMQSTCQSSRQVAAATSQLQAPHIPAPACKPPACT